MRKFTFSLETLLRCKQLRQDKAAEEFSSAQSAHRKCVEELADLRDRERSLRHDLKKQQSGRIDIGGLISHSRYLGHVAKTRQVKAEEAQRKEHETECRRQELVTVLKDRKVLERLKEKQFESFLREAASLEQKAADESAVNRFTRRSAYGR